MSSALSQGTPLLEVRDLVQEFRVPASSGLGHRVVQAVSGVSFQVRVGETVGVVGESGSGKSTVARSLLMAPRAKSGEVRFRGVDLMTAGSKELEAARREIQMVFQEPFSSLDPKWKVSSIVGEPLVIHGQGDRVQRKARVVELLDRVGLDPRRYGNVRPRQLSGGQAQRVAIARALAPDPSLVICDEAVSSLDVIIQAQVLNLLADLGEELALSYIFIAHDLSLIRQVTDRVIVMYLGKVCEVSSSAEMYDNPLHPYTAALLESIPELGTGEQARVSTAMRGEPPSPADPPSGCRFRTRCPYAAEICAAEEPPLRSFGGDRTVACHFPLNTPEQRSPGTVTAVSGGFGET